MWSGVRTLRPTEGGGVGEKRRRAAPQLSGVALLEMGG